MCDKPTALPSSPKSAAREGDGTFGLSAMHGPTDYCADLDGSIGPAPGPNGSVGNYQRVPALLSGVTVNLRLLEDSGAAFFLCWPRGAPLFIRAGAQRATAPE